MMFGLRSLRAASVQRMQPGKLRAGRAAEGLTKMVLVFQREWRCKTTNRTVVYTQAYAHTHTHSHALCGWNLYGILISMQRERIKGVWSEIYLCSISKAQTHRGAAVSSVIITIWNRSAIILEWVVRRVGGCGGGGRRVCLSVCLWHTQPVIKVAS